MLIILSSMGLGSVLTASGDLFNFIKILGAIYLFYLGVKLWSAPLTAIKKSSAHEEHQSRPLTLFKKGFLVTTSNPKALIYVSALLPQFINTQQSLLPQIVSIAVTYAVAQSTIFMSYAILASKARHWFENGAKRQLFNRFSGVTFMFFGITLGLSENKI